MSAEDRGGSFRRSFLIGLGLFGLMFLIDLFMFTSSEPMKLLTRQFGPATTGMMSLAGFLVTGPFFSGFLLGYFSPYKAVRAAVAAFLVWGGCFCHGRALCVDC